MMINEYSGIMKKWMKNPTRVYQEIALIILICVLLVVGCNAYLASTSKINAEMENAVTFDPFAGQKQTDTSASSPVNDAKKYSQLKVEYLSDPFAVSSDKTISYCIAIDADYYPYIVGLKTDSMDQYQALIDYTYGDSKTVPPTVILKGLPEDKSDALNQLSVDAINSFYDNDLATTANIKELLGSSSLNTTKTLSGDYSVSIACIVLCAAAVILVGILVNSQINHKKRILQLLTRLTEHDFMNIDQELSSPSTICMNKKNLYITSNYLISKLPVLDFIPLNKITHVYGYISADPIQKRQGVVVVTEDGVEHEIAIISSENKDNSMTTQIVDKLRSKLPSIQYGFETGFYAPGGKVGADSVSAKRSNVVLGIVGAMIGSALGSILWIAIGHAGYITGFAGLIMVILGMKGYSLLSGYMDRKGQIISVIITLLMLYAANYTTYVFEICSTNNTWKIVDIMDAYKQLPKLMTANSLWGYFYKDLILGYVFLLAASFGLIARSNTRQKTGKRKGILK